MVITFIFYPFLNLIWLNIQLQSLINYFNLKEIEQVTFLSKMPCNKNEKSRNVINLANDVLPNYKTMEKFKV